MGEYNFPARLFDALLDSDVTQKELAADLGITPGAVNRYLKGKSDCTTKRLYTIAKVTGASADYLLGLDDRKMVCVDDLADEQIAIIKNMVEQLKRSKE